MSTTSVVKNSVSVQTDFVFSQESACFSDYKCTDCGFVYAIYISPVVEGSLESIIGGRRYCFSCYYNYYFLPAERIPTNNPYDLGFWRRIGVNIQDFYCCCCKRVDYHHKLSLHHTGFVNIFIFIHYSSHRLCHFCFRDAVTLRRDLFNPKRCCLLPPE
jgi:hypothetical protein